jgi:LysR family glycine cleavage system transcriptional activator
MLCVHSAAAGGYGVAIGDRVMVAEDVAQGRLRLPWPLRGPVLAVSPWSSAKARRGQEQVWRLHDYRVAAVAALRMPDVSLLRSCSVGGELLQGGQGMTACLGI